MQSYQSRALPELTGCPHTGNTCCTGVLQTFCTDYQKVVRDRLIGNQSSCDILTLKLSMDQILKYCFYNYQNANHIAHTVTDYMTVSVGFRKNGEPL